jgi:hypothetical protein
MHLARAERKKATDQWSLLSGTPVFRAPGFGFLAFEAEYILHIE